MGNFVEGSRETTASTEALWLVLADVSRWPETFAPHLRQAGLDGPLKVGETGWVQTKIPIPKSRFVITAVDERRSWTWQGRILWLTMTFDHALEPTETGSRVVFDVDLDGVLARIVRPAFRLVYRPNMERALDMLVREAEGRP